MTGLHALILGVIQGLTEFLPVSSSGHLVLGSELLGLPAPGLSFSIAVHVGTSVATIVMFWDEIVWLISSIFGGSAYGRKAVVNLIIGSIPAALVGLFFKDLVESLFSSPLVASVGLLITGCVLKLSDKAFAKPVELPKSHGSFRSNGDEKIEIPSYRRNGEARRVSLKTFRQDNENTPLATVTPGRALATGIAQAIAIVPGVSRSGMTISSGLLSGISREDAARFSFLLALPATLGAALLDVKDLIEVGAKVVTKESLIGVFASLGTGIFAIALTYKLVKKGSLSKFAYYCWTVGLLSLFALLR